jgi:hypothetical protein
LYKGHCVVQCQREIQANLSPGVNLMKHFLSSQN